MKTKRLLALLLSFVMIFTILPMQVEAKASVKLNKTSVSVYEGKTVQLKLSGTKNVSWSSSNKKVATVSSNGKVTGVSIGKATITAKNKSTGKKYKCTVTVKDKVTLGEKEVCIYSRTEEDEFRGYPNWIYWCIQNRDEDQSNFSHQFKLKNAKGKVTWSLEGVPEWAENAVFLSKNGEVMVYENFLDTTNIKYYRGFNFTVVATDKKTSRTYKCKVYVFQQTLRSSGTAFLSLFTPSDWDFWSEETGSVNLLSYVPDDEEWRYTDFNFQGVTLGMTRSQVKKILGRNCYWWSNDEWHFTDTLMTYTNDVNLGNWWAGVSVHFNEDGVVDSWYIRR